MNHSAGRLPLRCKAAGGMRFCRSGPAALALGILLVGSALAPSLHAQDAADTLRVRVTEREGERPVSGARILDAGRVVGVTDEQGLSSVPVRSTGRVELEIQRVGFAAGHISLPRGFAGGRTATVALETEAVLLPGVRAQSETPAVRTRALKDFYRRATSGIGRYFTRAEIDRRNPRSLSDLFRSVPSMRLDPGTLDDRPQFAGEIGPGITTRVSTRRVNGGCEILYFLDGSPYHPHNGVIGAELRPQEIEGIEIYRNGTTAPAQYRRTNHTCGIILLWKRERH